MSGPGLIHEKDARWTAVDNYSFSHLHPSSRTTPSNDALAHALSNSASQGLPDIAVSPAQGKFLHIQARLLHARNILEIGTLGGYSTIWLAASSPDARVVSIEVDAHHADVARSNLEYAGVSSQVDIRLGAGVDVLPGIVDEVQQGKREKFQLVFIDADKESNWHYVDTVLGICEPGACVIVDNVVRQGRLAEETEDSRVLGAKRVVENVGRDERLDGVVLQTVGDKNYDGFLIAIVK